MCIWYVSLLGVFAGCVCTHVEVTDWYLVFSLIVLHLTYWDRVLPWTQSSLASPPTQLAWWEIPPFQPWEALGPQAGLSVYLGLICVLCVWQASAFLLNHLPSSHTISWWTTVSGMSPQTPWLDKASLLHSTAIHFRMQWFLKSLSI
jgi:hypothetical protein